MGKAISSVESATKAALGSGKKAVKVADVLTALAALVQEENRRVARIRAHRMGEGGPSARKYLGLGSAQVARRIRERLGLATQATRHSKQELTLALLPEFTRT